MFIPIHELKSWIFFNFNKSKVVFVRGQPDLCDRDPTPIQRQTRNCYTL